MSWDAYVDTSLVGSGQVDKAAIFSADGTSVWAASKGYQISPAEMKDVVAGFTDKGREKLQANGLHLAKEKFLIVKADERSIYGKKGKEGIIIVKTTQAILIGRHPDSVPSGNAANTVEQLADYLIGVGY